MNNDRFKFRVYDNDAGEYIDDGALLDGRTGRISGNGNYTIEQSTGQHDLNGKLIFEGDIVLIRGGIRGEIVWHHCCWCAYTGSFYVFLSARMQIMGNIHVEGARSCPA